MTFKIWVFTCRQCQIHILQHLPSKSSNPKWERADRYTIRTLVRDWSPCCFNTKQHHVHTASLWSLTQGADGAFWQPRDQTVSIWPQLAYLQAWGNYGFLAVWVGFSCKLNSGCHVWSLRINLEFQRQFETWCQCHITDWWGAFNSQRRHSECKNLLL